MNNLPNPSEYQASVVFTTINRPDDLRRALKSAIAQVPPVEVIVIGDGSPKEIVDMVTGEFPSVRMFYTTDTKGISVQRNWGARLATTPFIFSIDDDAEFTSSDTVMKTLKEFEHPLVGAVAMPFVDVLREVEHGTKLPKDGTLYVDSSFIGTAYALRKSLFTQLGGFEEGLKFQGEEEDYCARLLNAGYVICCGRTDPIFHYVSPIRSWEKITFLGARNAILFAFINVPMPSLIVHMLGTSVVNILSGIRKKRVFITIKGLIKGYRDCFSSAIKRRPVTVNTYKLIRRIRRSGPVNFLAIRDSLNSPQFD